MNKPVMMGASMAVIIGVIGYMYYGLVPALVGAAAAFVIVAGVGSLLGRKKPGDPR